MRYASFAFAVLPGVTAASALAQAQSVRIVIPRKLLTAVIRNIWDAGIGLTKPGR